MKILHLFPYLPTPPTFGGSIRMYHILKHLYQNHEVTAAGFSEHGDFDQFHQAFPKLRDRSTFVQRSYVEYHRLLQAWSLLTPHSHWYNWAQSSKLERQLNQLLSRESFDVILSEFATMGHFDLETSAHRVVDAHNVEYDNFRRMSQLDWSPMRTLFYKREYKKSYIEELDIFRKQDAIFTTSRRDSELIAKDLPDSRQYVIPNGVDIDYFIPKKVTPDPFTLVFTGAMHYVPNTDGMVTFLEKIFPLIQKRLPQTKVLVVGSNPPARLTRFRSSSVTITGFVEDVRPYIDQAALYIVPLYMGGGTRLKVVEALAMKKPIVSTSIGCEGIEVNDNEHLLIRDDHSAFADAVVELLQSPLLAKRLVENGHDRVREMYDWRVVGESIEHALLDILNHPKPTEKSVDYPVPNTYTRVLSQVP